MDIEFKKQNIFVRIFAIIIGTAIMAISTELFLLPNQLSSGGFSGIGTIIYYLWKVPLGTTTLILNAPLFMIAFFKNGKKFFVNTIIGTASLSLFYNLFQNLNPVTNDRFLACIYGGIMTGIGTAIVLKANASTGGSDLLANIIKVFKPSIRTGSVIVILDAIIIATNVLFFKHIEVGLYSAITIYLMGKMLDILFEGIDFSKMLLIISPKYEEISNEINTKIKRGTTALYGKGMYKQEEKEVLLCVASRGEIVEIRKIIKKIDPNAFIVISNAREVFGEGFKKEK